MPADLKTSVNLDRRSTELRTEQFLVFLIFVVQVLDHIICVVQVLFSLYCFPADLDHRRVLVFSVFPSSVTLASRISHVEHVAIKGQNLAAQAD